MLCGGQLSETVFIPRVHWEFVTSVFYCQNLSIYVSYKKSDLKASSNEDYEYNFILQF